MQSLLKKEGKRPLSYEMLSTLVPKWCRVTRYDALAKFKTLKDALQGKQMIVVLYNVHERISRKLVNMPGHFVVINTRASGQPTEYFPLVVGAPDKKSMPRTAIPKSSNGYWAKVLYITRSSSNKWAI